MLLDVCFIVVSSNSTWILCLVHFCIISVMLREAAVFYLQFASDIGVVQRNLASSPAPSSAGLASDIPQAPLSEQNYSTPGTQLSPVDEFDSIKFQ